MLSIVQICVPFLGLFAVAQAFTLLNVFGLLGRDVLAAVPLAGGSVIFGWWLSRHLFPAGNTSGYLGYDAGTRASGRRFTIAIAWVVAVGVLLDAGLQKVETTSAINGAIAWPFLALPGFLFWRLGRVIKTLPEPIEGETVSLGRMRGYVGQVFQFVGIAAPLIAAFGFVAAGRALLVPSILSAGLLGVLLLLQRICQDISQPPEDDTDRRGLFALLPVFISFVLFLASLPIFALIWGARVDDLLELWTRFSEGFALGETRVSPTDFVMFVAVFAAGYLLTRFIQGTLRKSVMPRTRLDLGGQNAVVAGFGYIGIILAAIVAITSAGIDLSNLAIVAGALSVGIGFGLQNIVSNFVSGIILLIERPVSEGDWIEVGGQMGYVRGISVRSTRIETFDRTDVIIPNADLVSGQVTNWTRGNLVGRVIVPVGVAYGTDVDKVTQILRGIAEAHPLVIMTPPPAVLFTAFGADSLDFEIRAILRDVNYVMVTKSEMNYEITKQFAAAGIEIPFAQRDIWLRNPEVLKDTT
jgi:small-conductance mechanosensitive channel